LLHNASILPDSGAALPGWHRVKGRGPAAQRGRRHPDAGAWAGQAANPVLSRGEVNRLMYIARETQASELALVSYFG